MPSRPLVHLGLKFRGFYLSQCCCVEFCFLVGSRSQSKADVMNNLDKLRFYSMPLTERELSILAVCVTELQQNRFRPFEDMFFVEVDSRLRALYICKIFQFFTIVLFCALWQISCRLSVTAISKNRPKDQNFHRATWTKSDPTLCPCLLPGGKYVVTKRWTCLEPQDWGCDKTTSNDKP